MIQKNIRFSPRVITVLEEEGKSLGMSFNKYLQFLANKQAEKLVQQKSGYNLDNLLEDIEQAKEHSKQGKLKSDSDIEKFVEKNVG